MLIYVDLLILVNFFFDFLILLATSRVLRRKINLKKHLMGAGVGAIASLSLFLPISPLTLFLIKLLVSILMIKVSYDCKKVTNLLKNLLFLYLVSIFLGGAIYFINNELSYFINANIYVFPGISINLLILIVLFPTLIYFYIKGMLEFKNNYANYYYVKIIFNNGHTLNLIGYLDTGNKLTDPYLRRPIILVNTEEIKFSFNENEILYVPYETLNNSGLLKCVKPLKLIINDKEVKGSFLVGISENKIKINGVNCILHPKLIKEE